MKIFFCLILILLSCCYSENENEFKYGTSSVEALARYRKGWEHILDHGEWTKAEQAFREAIELDSGFLLAWCQVGRISQNPEERSEIFQRLSAESHEVSGWEKKLLDVYLGSLQLIDSRDRGLPISPDQIKDFYVLSQQNFSDFLKVYPNEDAVNSEFIEVIHGIYGAAVALDSLQKQTQRGKVLSPFLISYSAQMKAKMKDFERAFQSAKDLENMLKNPELPIISFTYAFINFEKGAFGESEKLLNYTLMLDKNHSLAQRLKKQVEAKLN